MPPLRRPSSTPHQAPSAVAEEDRLLAALALTGRSDRVLARRMMRRLDRLRRELDRTRFELGACRVALASARGAAASETLTGPADRMDFEPPLRPAPSHDGPGRERG